MKKQFYFSGIITIMVIAFMLLDCSDQKNPLEGTNLEKIEAIGMRQGNSVDIINVSVPDCIIESDLWAGAAQNDLSNGTLVGNVVAFAWGDYVYVKYHITKDNCYLTEVHAYVNDQEPATAAPGQFNYKVKITEPFETTYMFQIPWQEKGWQCETVLYIAAHATVCCKDECCETAWAYGNYTFIDEGISKKWGWFFDLLLCCYGD